jgi:hypothetical protein
LPAALVTKALDEVRQGKPGTVWFGARDSTGAIIADPAICYAGRMDVGRIHEAGDESSIMVSFESRYRSLQIPRVRRFTHEDQQIDWPGDLGFQYMTEIVHGGESWGKSGPISIPAVTAPQTSELPGGGSVPIWPHEMP